MYTTAVEFRAQVEALETSAICNCIEQLAQRSSTLTRAGIASNCFHLGVLTNQQRAQIAEGVLAEREAQAEAMLTTSEPVESVASVEAAMPQAVVKPAKRTRCAHYGMIREFMAVAHEMGLDTEAKDRCRGAVGMLLGRRSDLNAAEWGFCTNALRMQRLFW